MTNETDTFVQEVDEQLREERMMGFLKKWGPWLLGGAIAFVLGIAGWQWWRDHSIGNARAHADEYVAAQTLARDGDIDGAREAFAALREKGPRSYRAMAQMEHAAILAVQGDLPAALAEFDAAAATASDPILRDTARLRAAFIAADVEDFPTLRQRLEPLISAENGFSFLARELLGVEAWEAGETDLARSTLEGLSLAFDAPEAVRERAQIALEVIGPAPATSPAAPAPATEGENQ